MTAVPSEILYCRNMDASAIRALNASLAIMNLVLGIPPKSSLIMIDDDGCWTAREMQIEDVIYLVVKGFLPLFDRRQQLVCGMGSPGTGRRYHLLLLLL